MKRADAIGEGLDGARDVARRACAVGATQVREVHDGDRRFGGTTRRRAAEVELDSRARRRCEQDLDRARLAQRRDQLEPALDPALLLR